MLLIIVPQIEKERLFFYGDIFIFPKYHSAGPTCLTLQVH